MNRDLLEKLARITPEEQRILNGSRDVDVSLYSNGGAFVVDSRKMLSSGHLIRIRTHTRFIRFPRHTHNYVEMTYMCAGETHHIINGSALTLKEGELLILNQHAEQEILPAGTNDIAVNFIILPEFFDQTLKMMGSIKNPLGDFLIGCLNSADSPVSYLHFAVSDVLPAQNLIENLVWTIMNDIPDVRHINEFTMGLLFLHLLSRTDRISSGGMNPDRELIISVLQYIDGHYRNGNLTSLSNMLDCEFTHLSKIIRRETGFTYQELLQQKRISKACELLSGTDLSVTDISLSVGYENFSYFHRLFRKYYGMSPAKYRKENRS